ncbi:MAG TPA: dienelactone hydrolase family protein [Thermoplasmata archaeon]|nr:dienelactone hydrolase family protein [Thermoplasmata archaeon]
MSDDQDLLLPDYPAVFGSGIIGVCDICGKRQAVIVLQKERFKLCVLDFLNKSWLNTTLKPGAPLPPYRSDRVWFPTAVSASGSASAILLTPTKLVRHPTVLITPDVYGVTTALLDAAIRFAKDGYEVLVPEVGNASGIGFPEHLATRSGAYLAGGVPLRSPRTRKLVLYFQDALRYVRARPMADPDKTAVFGVGFGGSLALGVAGEEQKLTAVVLAYPMPVRPSGYAELVTAPVLFVDAGRDGASRRSRRSFESRAPQAGSPVEYADFPDARRNFLSRDLRAYDLALAEAAWGRILLFLKSRLQPPPPKPPAPKTAAPPAVAPPSAPSAPTPSVMGAPRVPVTPRPPATTG